MSKDVNALCSPIQCKCKLLSFEFNWLFFEEECDQCCRVFKNAWQSKKLLLEYKFILERI